MTSFRNAEDRGGTARAGDVRRPPRPPVPPIPAAGGSPAPPRCRSSTTRASPSIPRATSTSTASSSGSTGPTPSFTETGRNADVIPPDVHASEGYNHIGDISWDRAEGGRVLLPLECYVPNGPNGGNPCLHGSIGVADPGTLQWRYYVKLDPAEIPKAMWNEVSPDGTLVWTSSGGDLLAYRAADISLANAAPAHAPIHSVRRLQGRRAADGDHRAPRSSTGGCSSRGRTARRSASTRSTSPPGRASSRSSARSWASRRGSSPRRARAGRSAG